MLFEEQPLILLVLIVVVTEIWIRARVPLFKAFSRLGRRSET